MALQVVDYDPAWPGMAATAMTELDDVFDEIEHIGSTAVPGLAAKPTIDLMAPVEDLTTVARHDETLTRLGYHSQTSPIPDRLLYARDDGDVRTHILHVVTLASWPARNQRLLRDYLRTHPQDAERYGELKRSLIVSGIASGDYAAAKTGLIQELTDRARAERGLPSVPVWE